MDQQRLDATLILLDRYSKEEVSWADLQQTIDHEAATLLHSQGLSGLMVTKMQSGSYRLRVETVPVTPRGQARLAAIGQG
jgi:hypothetical protein